MGLTRTAVSDVLEAVIARIELLHCLRDESQTVPALVDELDVARSTVDRAVSTLETIQLIESADDGYRATPTGQRVTTGIFDLADAVAGAYHDQNHTTDEIPALTVLETGTRRIEFLEHLLNEPMDKRALVDNLGMSRATVDRGVRELETLGLVEYIDGCFTVTPIGELAVSGLSDLSELIALRRQLDPFLTWIPEKTLDIDLRLLADAELVVAEPGDPWTMVNRHVQVLRDMDYGRAMLPLTGLHAMETVCERVTNAGATFETVVTPSVAETLQSTPDYVTLFNKMVATGRFHLFVYDGTIPYFLGILDETVQMGADEDGDPRALLETDDDEVRDWVESKYQAYKQRSEKIT